MRRNNSTTKLFLKIFQREYFRHTTLRKFIVLIKLIDGSKHSRDEINSETKIKILTSSLRLTKTSIK